MISPTLLAARHARHAMRSRASALMLRRLLHESNFQRTAAATNVLRNSNVWSINQSHGTPAADLTAVHVSASGATVEAELSQQMTVASPDSEFKGTRHVLCTSASGATAEAEWSQDLTFASPESDFTALQESLNQPDPAAEAANAEALIQMLHKWQLSSPESAIGYTNVIETMNASTRNDFQTVLKNFHLPITPPCESTESKPQQELYTEEADCIMKHLQLSSPESALGFTHVSETLDAKSLQDLQSLYVGQDFPSALPESTVEKASVDDAAVNLIMQHFLRASPESAVGFAPVMETLTTEERQALIKAVQRPQPLPKTSQEAVTDHSERAIVITTATAPFKVVHVNRTWEGLCEYSQQEALGKPIGELLQGPESQRQAARHMVSEVLRTPEQEHELHIVNYTKTGRKFYNHLQVGPLYSENSSKDKTQVEYLVGILTEETVPVQQQMAA